MAPPLVSLALPPAAATSARRPSSASVGMRRRPLPGRVVSRDAAVGLFFRGHNVARPLGLSCEAAGPSGSDLSTAPGWKAAPFDMPDLPFKADALEPYLSAEQMTQHHDKHLRNYIDSLNKQITNHPELKDKPLEEVMVEAEGRRPDLTSVYNCAAQAWNHEFFFNSLAPAPSGGAMHPPQPPPGLLKVICANFGSMEEFTQTFSAAAATLFGSGWVWVVETKDSRLDVVATSNADNPLTQGLKPLLCLDVWEHAYYIDYRHQRPLYIEKFWHVVDWDTVEARWQEPRGVVSVGPREAAIASEDDE